MAAYGSNTSTSNKSGTSSSTSTTNMDPASLAALTALIAQLSGGGGNQQSADLQQEIATNRASREDYSKNAAFTDAQGAMGAQMRKMLEQLLPSITRSAEGSGTSQNSLRALLTQDAAAKAAEGGASLGLQAATQYGGINANLSQILAGLVSQDDPATKALLAALSIAKGAQSESTSQNNSGGGINLGYNPGSGNASAGTSFQRPQQSFMMSSSGNGMSNTDYQIGNINKQLGIIQQLDGMGAYSGNMGLLNGNTF